MPATFLDIPEELICYILMLVRWSPNSFKNLYYGRWLPITQVNSQWRRIAIHYQPLWAGAICTFFNSEGTSEALRRAGQARLAFVPVRYGRNTEMNPHHYDLALAHLDRIAVLRTFADDDPKDWFTYPDTHPIHPFIPQLAEAPRPGLTELAIRRFVDNARAFELDVHLVAPALRVLSLEGLLFRVDVPHLRVLTIRGVYAAWGFHFRGKSLGLAPIHTFLRAHTLLEELTLGHVWIELDHEIEDEVVPAEIISLPHLRKLSLAGNQFKPDILRMLEVPLGLELYIRDYGIYPPRTFRALAAHIEREGFDSVVYRDYDRTNRHGFTGLGTVQYTSETVVDSTRVPMLMIDFQYYNFFGINLINPDAIIEQIVATLPKLRLLDIHDIGATSHSQISADDLRPHLLRMQDVTTLHISVDKYENHAPALCDTYPPSQALPPANEFPLPALQTLYVHGVVCEDRRHSETSEVVGPNRKASIQAMWSSLIGMLARRKNAGYPVRTLVLRADKEFLGHFCFEPWADEVDDIDAEGFEAIRGLVEVTKDMRILKRYPYYSYY